MKKIAVVTTTYNTSQDTNALLQSLEKIKIDDFELEIIITDNGSKEPYTLPKGIKQNTTITRLDHNIGFTGGYNNGMKKALDDKADYVLIVNNDTIMNPNLIKNLLSVLEQDPKIGLVVPKIYFSQKRSKFLTEIDEALLEEVKLVEKLRLSGQNIWNRKDLNDGNVSYLPDLDSL